MFSLKNLAKSMNNICESICCVCPTLASIVKANNEAEEVLNEENSFYNSQILTQQPRSLKYDCEYQKSSSNNNNITTIFAIYTPLYHNYESLNHEFYDISLNEEKLERSHSSKVSISSSNMDYSSSDESALMTMTMSSQESLPSVFNSTKLSGFTSELSLKQLLQQSFCIPLIDNRYLRISSLNSHYSQSTSRLARTSNKIFTSLYPLIRTYTVSPIMLLKSKFDKLSTNFNKSIAQATPTVFAISSATTDVQITPTTLTTSNCNKSNNSRSQSYGFTPFRQFLLRFTDANFI